MGHSHTAATLLPATSDQPLNAVAAKEANGTIGGVVSRFIAEIDSLADTLPLSMRSIAAARKGAREEMNKFAVQNGGMESGGRITFQVPPEKHHRFDRLLKRVQRTNAASALVPRTLVVALVSQYDSFLGSLIKVLLLSRPEVLNGSDKSLSFAELISYGSLDAARDHIVEKEVESVLRGSHTEQFEWLETKFKIKLRQDLTAWPRFIELTERRNLFVHTGFNGLRKFFFLPLPARPSFRPIHRKLSDSPSRLQRNNPRVAARGYAGVLPFSVCGGV